MFVYSIILPIKHTVFSSQQLFSVLSSVNRLVERDGYFDRGNETTSSNSIQRFVGILSAYWSIGWVGW